MQAHEARALMISCMDFRLLDDTCFFMKKIGYHDNYDQVILAGASLGYLQPKFPEWGPTFEKHVELAK